MRNKNTNMMRFRVVLSSPGDFRFLRIVGLSFSGFFRASCVFQMFCIFVFLEFSRVAFVFQLLFFVFFEFGVLNVRLCSLSFRASRTFRFFTFCLEGGGGSNLFECFSDFSVFSMFERSYASVFFRHLMFSRIVACV